MAIINMKLEIVNMLSGVTGLAKFSTDYPSEMTDFPCAVYRTTSTPYAIDEKRQEMQTKWDVIIEVYGENSVSSLARSISDGMRGIGFEVIQRDSNTAGLKRIVLNGRGIVDNLTKQVYL